MDEEKIIKYTPAERTSPLTGRTPTMEMRGDIAELKHQLRQAHKKISQMEQQVSLLWSDLQMRMRDQSFRERLTKELKKGGGHE